MKTEFSIADGIVYFLQITNPPNIRNHYKMGTFSEEILGSDNSIDVYEDFFEEYNAGKEIAAITEYIKEKYFANDIVERLDYLSALCKAKWETRSLEIELITELTAIANDQSLYDLLKEFGASDKFIKARKKVLEKFIIKISTERNSAKKRKKS